MANLWAVSSRFQAYFFPFLLVLVTFLSFWNLSANSLEPWDESRHAANAYEMMHRGDYINLYYNDLPDTWNAKPPLMIWAIVASYKAFGVNEFAVRFPSAVMTIVFFFFAFKIIRLYENERVAMLVCMMLVASRAIIAFHIGRTGDADAMFIAFLTAFIYYGLKYLEFQEKNAILYAGVFLGLAFYTKGFAFGLVVPAILAYLLLKRISFPFKDKYFYFGISIMLLFIASWIMLGAMYGEVVDNPAYRGKSAIERMLLYDIIDRFTQKVFDSKQHDHGKDYVLTVFDRRFNIWSYFMWVALALGFYQAYQHRKNLFQWLNQPQNRLPLFSACMVLSLCLILTISVNKCDWYLAPIKLFAAYLAYKSIRWVCRFHYSFPYLMVFVWLYAFAMFYYKEIYIIDDYEKIFMKKHSELIKNAPSVFDTDGITCYQNIYVYEKWLNYKVTNAFADTNSVVIYLNNRKDYQARYHLIDSTGWFCIGKWKKEVIDTVKLKPYTN
ncbi:MAG: ArnT family glycosyltransferase [Bacteroidia bacterium]